MNISTHGPSFSLVQLVGDLAAQVGDPHLVVGGRGISLLGLQDGKRIGRDSEEGKMKLEFGSVIVVVIIESRKKMRGKKEQRVV